jgi:hypothetical protein
MDDCEVCGASLDFVDENGMIQPDADVFCDCCGAHSIVNTNEAGDDAWLTLYQTGAERLKAALERADKAEEDYQRVWQVLPIRHGDLVERMQEVVDELELTKAQSKAYEEAYKALREATQNG